MKLDIRTIEGIYDMLISTHVLRDVGLPPSYEVEFELLSMKENCMASYTPDPHTIGVCPQRHRFLTSVIKSMLHEIIHMTNHLYGHSYLKHDKHFKELRKHIADELGFDENEI